MATFKNFLRHIGITQIDRACEAVLVDAAYHPASTAFVDTKGFDRWAFLIELGTIADALTFAVFQDTSATVTAGVKAISGATKTIATNDDKKILIIEGGVSLLDIANSFRYITCKVSGVSGSNYAAIIPLLWRGGPSGLAISQSAGVLSVTLGG